METRNCQNCKKDFIIDQDDFSFYEKIKVPAPTFCPECRMQRRWMFMNERVLYKSTCDLCKNPTITIFSPESPYKILCSKCWQGDGWESGDYYLDYDPTKNFFEQIKELQLKTYFRDKISSFSTLINSEYVNHTSRSKDCYLLFNSASCENVYYSTNVIDVKDSSDSVMVGPAELLYGSIGGKGSSSVFFSKNCTGSINMWYSKDCVGCSDCFGCVNLRKKKYCIYNVEYSKEEYLEKIKAMELDKHSTHIEIRKHIYDFWNKFPYRYVHGRLNNNVTGDYIVGSKNAKNCYRGQGMENSAYCQFISISPIKDCYDISHWGDNAELCIEGITVGNAVSDIKYCSGASKSCRSIEYSMYVANSSNCFGCVNLLKKEYCILNKQYTKEEYFALREKIIADLEKNPYIDKKGRVFKYGEFFPYDLSPFSYNESFAMQYIPLSKDQIESAGFRYQEPIKSEHKATVPLADISDSIYDIGDDFTKEVLECSCGKFYRIVPGELKLLKRLGIPVPRQCSDCRHMFRMSLLNSFYLYDRTCDKCGVDLKTSFAPGRPEIIYCESCYQKEVN